MMLKKKVHQLLAACLALAIMGVPMLTAFAETSIYSEPVYVEGFQKETTPDEEKQESLTESGLESASASDDVTVSFYVGDQLYLTEAIDTNTLARVPQDPAPGPGEGHFVGWFEEDASSPFDFNTIVESDLALTARFSEQYLVQFLDTRGSVVNVSWVAPGAAVSPYDSDALNISADKQFIHWYEEGENPEVPFDFSQAIDRNTRLRPYLKDTLLLVFVSEGTQVPPQVINPQEKVTLPANDEMTRPGYAFRYWSTEKNGKTAYEPDYETASFTLYAVWEKQKVTYSVIYWKEKPNVIGEPSLPTDYMYAYTRTGTDAYAGDIIQMDAAKAKTLLSSVATDATYLNTHFTYVQGDEGVVALGDSSAVVNVYYKRNIYQVTFEFNAGTTASTLGASAFRLVNDTEDRPLSVGNSQYVMSVKLDQNVHTIWPYSVTLSGTAPFSLWAKWYSLSQDASATFSETMYTTMTVDLKSYNFKFPASYAKTNDFVTRMYYLEVAEMPDSATLASGLASGRYEWFTYNGVARLYEYRPEYTTSYQQSGTVPSGYKGWPGKSLPGFRTANTTRNGDHQLYPIELKDAAGKPLKNALDQTMYDLHYYMDRLSYKITWNAMGGKLSGGKETAVAATILFEAPVPDSVFEEVPVKENATFIGWFYDQGFQEPAVPGIRMPGYDVVLYAKHQNSGVTVSFYESEDATSPMAVRATSPGGLVSYPEGSFTVGQAYDGLGVFKGWAFYVSGIPAEFSDTMPIATDMSVYAQWEGISHTITYYADNAGTEELGTQQILATGGQDTLAKHQLYTPIPSTPAGYGFLGWYTDPAGTPGTRFTAGTPVTGDVAVYPVFAEPLTIGGMNDVYSNTNLAKAVDGVLYWGDGLISANILAAAAPEVSTGHGNVTVRSIRVDVGNKTIYPPTQAAKDALTPADAYPLTVTVTDSIGRTATASLSLYVFDDTAPVVGGAREAVQPVGIGPQTTQALFDALIGQAGLSDDFATAQQLYESLRVSDTDIDFAEAGTYFIDYTVTDTVGNQTTVRVDVTIYQPYVDVSVVKVWEDDENALGGRPADVRIQLYRALPEGRPEPVEAPATLSGGSTDNEWIYSYGELLACDNRGVTYVYSVEELDGHPNYAASHEGLTITNTLRTITLDGEKVWNILGSGYEKPESVTIELYRSDAPDQVFATRQVSGTGDTWAFSFDGLLAYDAAGEPYAYAVREAESEVPAYIESSVLDTTITNTYAADEIIAVRAEWDHTGAPQSMRPTEATLLLLRDGVEYARVTVGSGDAWQASFTVPRIDYVDSVFSLAQEPVAQYDTSYDEENGVLVARNAFDMPMLEISGSKEWSGTPRGYNVPGVIVDLLRDGEEEGQSLQIASGQRDFTFPQEVPQYDGDGEAYAYTVRERKVPAYDTGVDEAGLHLTNTYNPVKATYEVVGEKTVSGEGAPDEVFSFTMTARDAGQPMPDGSANGTLTVTAKAGAIRFGTLTFPLPGDYVYEIREVPGGTRGFDYDDEVYTLTLTVTDGGEGALLVNAALKGIRNSEPQGIVFTNAYTIPTDDVVVTKVWADDGNALGVRPDSVEMQLYRTLAGGLAEAVGEAERFSGSATGDSWTHTFPALPVHDTQGRAYTYHVLEQNISPNYASAPDGLTVINTLQPISVTLTKAWNILGTGFEKPDAVIFELWRTPAGGTAERVLEDVAVSGASLSDTWTETVPNLPAYDKDGNLYTYSAQEPNPPFATTAEAEGLTVTNTYAADQEITVAKTWNHTGSPSHPASATLTLHRNGEEVPYASVDLSEENGWHHVFEVPQKDYLGAGFEVREADIRDYSATISGDAEHGFTVHNEYIMPQVSVSGGKTWVGIPESGVSKPSVIVYLYRSDDPSRPLDSMLLAADDTYTFSGLDQYNPQGRPYVYTVSEGATPGFEQRQDGLDFTNTYAPDDAYVPVSGEKRIWGDTGYPEAGFVFTLTRLTAGAPMPEDTAGDTVTLTAGEGAFTFGNIAYTVPGTFVYRIRETVPAAADAIEGFAYDIAVYELTVTVTFVDGMLSTETALTRNGEAADAILFDNGYFTPTRDLTAAMAWADDKDALGVRPDSVELVLERTPAGGGKEDVETRVVAAVPGDRWETVFEDMPVHDALGRAYTYSVRELHTSPNYASVPSGLVVTDTLQPISVTLTKTWNILGTGFVKPGSIAFELGRTPAGGAAERVLADVAVSGASQDNTWTKTVDHLPAYDKEGNLYTYTAREPAPPFATTAEAEGLTVTNTYAADAEIAFTMYWDTTGAPADQRPDEAVLTLYRTGDDGTALYQDITLRKSEGWRYILAVPQVDYLNADFFLEALDIEGYRSDITGNALNGFVVNNTFEMPLDNISGTKTWRDVPGIVTVPAVVINLWRSDDAVTPYQTYALQSGEEAYAFTGLPRYDDDGNAYAYTVEEGTPPGYVSEKQGETDFVNTYAPQSIGFVPTAQKTISGDTGFPETAFAFTLKATGTGETHPMPADSVNGLKTVRRTGMGAVDFGELTFTRPGDYLYEVAEAVPVDAEKTEGFAYDETVYELALTVRDEGDGTLSVNPAYRVKDGGVVAGFVFENGYTTPTRDIEAEVHWVDQDDALALRPGEAKLQLQRTPEGGVPENVDDVTLEGDTNLWRHTFPGMPLHDAAGNAYTYAIVAVDVDAHYAAEVAGFRLTNTLKEARVTGAKEASPAPAAQGTAPVVNAGDPIFYRITLQNTGDRDVYETRVMDTLPAGVTLQENAVTPGPDASIANPDGTTTLMWLIPQLALNGSVTIEIPVTVDALAEGERSRLMENTAYYRLAESAGESLPLDSGVADDPAGYTATQTVAHQLVTLEQRANVAEGATLVEGQQVEYTLTLHNAAPMAGIEVWDVLPVGMTLVPGSIRSSLHPGASNAFLGNGILHLPGAKAPAGGATFTFRAAVDKLLDVMSLSLTNRASANATVSAGAPAVNPVIEPITHTATRRQVAIDLTARLYDGGTPEALAAGTPEDPVPTALGQTIEYRLTLQSDGYLPRGDVLVTQTLAPGMIFVEGSTLVLEADAGVQVTPSRSGNALSWRVSGLPADETVVFTFRATAPATTGDGTVRDLVGQATVEDLGLRALKTYTGKPVYTDAAQLSSQSGLTVHRLAIPRVETAKIASPSGENGKAVALETGDVITYTIRVRNTGHAEARNVRVMDILPEGLSFVEGSLLADGEALTNGSAKTLSSGLRLTPHVVAGNGQTALYWVMDAIEGENALTHPGMEAVVLSFDAVVTDTGRGMALSNTAYTLVPDAGSPAPAAPSDVEDPTAYTPSPSTAKHQTFSFTASSNPAGGADAASATRVPEGGKVAYTLTLDAGAAMDKVVVRDTLPEGMTLVPGSIRMVRPGGAVTNIPDSALAGRTITWPETSVGAGQTKFECTVLVDKLPEGTLERAYQNAAQVSLDNGATGAAHKTLSRQAGDLFHSADTGFNAIALHAALTRNGAAKAVDNGTQAAPVVVERGQQVAYTIVVDRTAAPGNRSGNLVITDTLPKGMTLVAGSIQGAVSGGQGQVVSARQVGDAVEWVLHGLADGESAMLSFTAEITVAYDAATSGAYHDFINQATLLDKGLEGLTYALAASGHTAGSRVYEAEQYMLTSNSTFHRVQFPALTAIKSASQAEGRLRAGTEMTYTISVTNQGQGDALQVLVRDRIPDGLAYVDGSMTASVEGAVMELRTVDGKPYATWVLPGLAAGQQAELTFGVRVQELPEDQSVARYQNIAEYREADTAEAAAAQLDSGKGFAATNMVEHYQRAGGEILVRKMAADTKELLPEAVFTLVQLSAKEPEGRWSGPSVLTTGYDGMALFEDLPAGDYVLYETVAPEGYLVSTIHRSINISGSGRRTVTISDRPASGVLGEVDEELIGIGNRNVGLCKR